MNILLTEDVPFLEESLMAGIVIFILGILIVILIARNSKKKKSTPTVKEHNGTITSVFQHVNGLPIAEDVACNVSSLPDKFEIVANGTTFNLDKSRITDVCMKTDVEIQQQYVSSVGGAIGGAVLFGPLGAVIGGRAKKKKTRNVTQYLIITYTKDDEIKYIGFEVGQNFWQAGKMVDEFRMNNARENHTVDL